MDGSGDDFMRFLIALQWAWTALPYVGLIVGGTALLVAVAAGLRGSRPQKK